ncbi:MAG: TonB-dependent receptor [Flavobacteriaceae bacterium]|nr:TonB-dependent receptor [Flavobacteriaceae bacterium]
MNNIIRVFLLLFFMNVFSQEIELNDTLNIFILEEVKVSTIRAKSTDPVTHTNINKEDIKSRNLGQDIPILLNYLPGVVTTSDAGAGIGYTGIRVRGSDASRVNVTLNGIPFNDSESQGTFWVNLPDFASSVESIQLQRGVGTSTNGSGAFGASLNILTDAVQDDTFASLSSSVGSFNTFRNTLKFSTGLLSNHFELSGRLSKINSDGYVDRASSNLKSYFLQGAFRDKNTLIKALAFGGHEITYQSWYGIEDLSNRTYNPAGEIYDQNGNLSGFYDKQEDNYRQDHYQLHWNEKLNSSWSASLGLNYTYGRGYYEEFNDSGSQTSFSYLGLIPLDIGNQIISETKNVTRKWLDNDYYVMTLSANYFKNKTRLDFGMLFSRYIGDHFGTLIWGQNLGEVLPRNRFYENQGDKKEINFFVKIQQPINERINSFIDFQYRNVNYDVYGQIAGPMLFNVESNYKFFNPKAGLTYQISDDQQFYFSYSKAQREPSRSDFENGNPKPEILNDFELGWRINKNQFYIYSNIYLMAYKDQLALTGALDDVGTPIRENIGESNRLGLEIEAMFNILGKLSLQPNIAISKNTNKDFYFKRNGILTFLGDTNLSYSPELVIGNMLKYSPSENLNFSFLTKFIGDQYMSNIDSEKSMLDSYSTSDLNVSYMFDNSFGFKNITLNLLVNNIFNKEYISNGYFYTYDDNWTNPGSVKTIEGVGYYPQAGLNFILGLTVDF